MVARQHAQPAGIHREALVDRELGTEIRHPHLALLGVWFAAYQALCLR